MNVPTSISMKPLPHLKVGKILLMYYLIDIQNCIIKNDIFTNFEKFQKQSVFPKKEEQEKY